MEERVTRVYRFKKVLKYSILSLLLAIVGILIFEYFRIKPNNVYFTNITSSSVTVSWDTKVKTDATAIYVEPKNKLPFLILPIFKEIFFDTRDVSKAELEATQQSLQELKDISITMEDVVTNISLSQKGRYYTHHIEIKGLEPEKEYSFMVGDSIVFRKVKDVNNETVAKTYAVPDSILTPFPAYGAVRDTMNQFDIALADMFIVNDGILYFNFYDKDTGEKSNLYSSALSESGTWYIDIGSAIDKEGNYFLDTYDGGEEGYIYAELNLNAGPIGSFSRIDIASITSPTKTFIINIPEIQSLVMKQDGYFSLFSKLIKEVKAEENVEDCIEKCEDCFCTFVSWCGVEMRSSSGGTKVYYNENGQYRNCSLGSATERMDLCDGEEEQKRKDHLCPGYEESSDEPEVSFCTNPKVLAGSDAQLKNGTCQQCDFWGNDPNPSWETVNEEECDSGSDNSNACNGDGKKKTLNPTSSNLKCSDCDGCYCTTAIVGNNTSGFIVDNATCYKAANVSNSDENNPNINPPEQEEEKMVTFEQQSELNCEASVGGHWAKGCFCHDPNSKVNPEEDICECKRNFLPSADNSKCIERTYNTLKDGDGCLIKETKTWGTISNDVCTPPTESNPLKPDDFICWVNADTYGVTFFDENGEPFDCNTKNNTLDNDALSNDTVCIEGQSCSKDEKNHACINSLSGKSLVCRRLFPLGFFWRSAISMEDVQISSEPIKTLNGREICDQEKCFCISEFHDFISKDDVCPEITEKTCLDSSLYDDPYYKHYYKGKTCDTSGHTCLTGDSNECTGPIPSDLKAGSFIKHPSKAYAQEENTFEGEKYIIDQTTGMISGIKEGIYIFEYENQEYVFVVTNEDAQNGNVLIFVDNNDNGTYEEGIDIKASEFGAEIEIQTIKKAYNYNLKQGYNFVSFPFISENGTARTASGMLTMLNTFTNGSIYSISKFDGSWKIVGQNKEKYDGEDFQLIPGQGYVIKALRNSEVSISGFPVKYESVEDTAPVTLMPGWNLIGIYGTNVKSYTAKSMLQDINAFEAVDFTADNVSKWESDVQRYEGYQLTNENGIDIEYGFDYPLNILQSYFVRINQGTGNWQPKLAE